MIRPGRGSTDKITKFLNDQNVDIRSFFTEAQIEALIKAVDTEFETNDFVKKKGFERPTNEQILYRYVCDVTK